MKPHVLAIDLGGTHVTCGLVSGKTLVGEATLNLADTLLLGPVLPQIATALRELLDQHGIPQSDVAGIGLGFCGIALSRENRVASTNGKYEDAPSLDLPGWALEEFDLPLRIENDARMALLGESYVGAARGETDVVMFTLGTGIGGVAMIDGRLLEGKHGQAGLLGGHFPVRIDGRPCTCGAIGCAESEAGGWALPAVCREWPGFPSSILAGQELNFRNLFAAADTGDRLAVEVREHCLKVWSLAAVAAIHAFDPDVLVYGGGVMRSADLILPYIQNHVAKHTWTPWGTVQVRAAQLGDRAALLGAVPLLSQTESPVSRSHVR